MVATGEGGAYTGESFLILARYTAAGQLDPEFNQTGIITMTVNGRSAAANVEIQSDGKIVVAGVTVPENGIYQLLLLRFNDDGTLDQSFGNGGIVTGLPNKSTIGRAFAIQNDGKIVATGLRFVARYIGAYEAMLSLTKTVTPSIISPGQYLTYTLAFTNVGLMTAQNVIITDTLPVSLTNVMVTSSSLITDTGTHPAYVWLVQDLSPGQGGIITITGQLSSTTSSGPLVNSAMIFAALEDGNPGNATATVSATVTESSTPGSDLKIEMTDYPDPVTAGEQLTYYITVTNQGPDDAIGVVVSDTLPTGVSGSVTSGCAEDPVGVPICSLGSIAASNSASYSITMTVDNNTTETLTNSAQVNASTTLVNPDDDIIHETTTVNVESDLAITKLVSSHVEQLTDTVSVDPSSVVTFTLIVSNNGPSSVVSGTQVTDMIPTGLTFESFVSATGGNFGNTGNQITWVDLPEFSPNITSHTLVFRARVDADVAGQTIQNTAQITSTPQFDPDSSNNSSSATVIVGQNMIFLPIVRKD